MLAQNKYYRASFLKKFKVEWLSLTPSDILFLHFLQNSIFTDSVI